MNDLLTPKVKVICPAALATVGCHLELSHLLNDGTHSCDLERRAGTLDQGDSYTLDVPPCPSQLVQGSASPPGTCASSDIPEIKGMTLSPKQWPLLDS
jgi:hypothetical protein